LYFLHVCPEEDSSDLFAPKSLRLEPFGVQIGSLLAHHQVDPGDLASIKGGYANSVSTARLIA
jgi:hypothetical protein